MTHIKQGIPSLLIPNGVATVEVFYYLPDYPSLVEEFVWQTSDFHPVYPRVRRFLDFWSENVEAVIKEILLTHDRASGKKAIRVVNSTFTLQ